MTPRTVNRTTEGQTEYLVKWKGWSKSTWEPVAHLEDNKCLHEFIESDGKGEYIVEAVKGVRVTKAGRWEYEVKWQGWSKTEWVPEANLQNNECLHAFRASSGSKAASKGEGKGKATGEYVVEAVKGVRVKAGRRQYEVKWKDFGETTWEPVAHLEDNKCLHEFIESNCRKASSKGEGKGKAKGEYNVEAVKGFRKGKGGQPEYEVPNPNLSPNPNPKPNPNPTLTQP